MIGITASKSMGRIRGKDEVSELRKPKKRGSKPNGSRKKVASPMGQHGRNNRQQTLGKNKR